MVTGYDGTDPGARDRRLAVRERHLELGAKLTAEGRMLHGSAIVDDDGGMIGSVLILDYPSRAELDAWLAVEPYVVAGVWRRVDIVRVRVGEAFLPGHT
ncbi:YciI family protein [Streptomyces sp. NPDC093085]|uniref:YciI family protein n=1 Tax=Streptomyces sp. NPDC093085 TaxID=3155068 RepID=UPI003437274C